jgi:hypothetical protein
LGGEHHDAALRHVQGVVVLPFLAAGETVIQDHGRPGRLRRLHAGHRDEQVIGDRIAGSRCARTAFNLYLKRPDW